MLLFSEITAYAAFLINLGIMVLAPQRSWRLINAGLLIIYLIVFFQLRAH